MSALDRWRAATDGPLMMLAIGTLPILLVELGAHDLPRSDQAIIAAVNVTVLVCFAIDYAVELMLATEKLRHIRREWAAALIIVTQAVALFPGLAAFGALRALRGGRALRPFLVIVRLVAIGGVTAGQTRQFIRRHAANVALGAAAMTWLTSAAAFTLIEDVGVDGRVRSFTDALWWSTTTITTVGYGDVYPVTSGGRLVGAFTMVVGISTFAVVTAKVAEFLVRPEPDQP